MNLTCTRHSRSCVLCLSRYPLYVHSFLFSSLCKEERINELLNIVERRVKGLHEKKRFKYPYLATESLVIDYPEMDAIYDRDEVLDRLFGWLATGIIYDAAQATNISRIFLHAFQLNREEVCLHVPRKSL